MTTETTIDDVLTGRAKWCVVTGDCLDVLRTIPAGSVDAVVTDPPYGMAYQSAWRYQSARRTDKAERFDQIANDDAPFVWWLPEAMRVLKDGGSLACFCRWDSAEAFRQAIGWAGFTIGGQVVWDRMVHGMGDLTGAVAPMHDTIWFARKGRFEWPGSRLKSVLRHQRLDGEQLVHPNEKPVGLMGEIVAAMTTPEALVVDPFNGSGATGNACQQHGRRYVGIEIDEGYAAIARRRISEAANHLFAETNQ